MMKKINIVGIVTVVALGFLAGRAEAQVGTGGVITYTDINGLNPTNMPYLVGYVVHTFTNSGTYSNSYAVSANVLVVGGGGGGGCVGTTGGGGGAGGVTNNTAYAVVSGSNYTVTVGAGGLGGKIGTGARNATSGSNSVFGAITALGGGNGAGNTQNAGTGSGVVGSGGGGAYPGSGGARGTGTPGQGKDGGAGQTVSLYGQGGGGGAGSDGQGGSGSYGGTGGDGLYFAAFSSWGDTNNPGYFGGGGGGSYRGGVTAGGLGGKGGGGRGGNGVGLAGQPNTGGGGGGADYNGGGSVTAGDGGSGIVIVRYPYDSGSLYVSVTAPANGQQFASGSSVTATVSVANGTPPYSVTFYTNGVSAWSTNNTSATLFSIPLGPLPVGTYTNYATVTDSAGTPATATSATLTFSADGTAPTLAGSAIVDDKSGGPVGRYTPVTYTVTFSEDMAASTVDAADFGNAGSSMITVGSITETSPGVFSVVVTPTSVGTLQLKISAGAFLTDAAGNALDATSAIPDDTTLTVTAGSALTLTWSGTTDMVWTQPDSTSWNEPYYSGDSALFTGSGTGTVTISGTVTPLSVNVSAGSYTFSGDSLTTTGDIYVTSNGSLTLSNNVTVGNTRVFGLGTTTSASTSAMVVDSGVLNVGAGGGAVMIGGGAGTDQSGKGSLVINGGTVNVGAAGSSAQGVDASKLWLNGYGLGGSSARIDLNGGMLSTARSIENGSLYSGSPVVNLNGGTLQAAGAIDLIAAVTTPGFVRRTTVNVLSGGAIIDTQSFNASISESLRDGGGGGGLTKAGLGTLTLTGANTYTGNTTINAGTLEVSGSLASTNIAVSATTTLVLLNTTCLSTNAVLSYAVGATNTLNYSGTQTVHAIYINGFPKPAGVYHSGNCPVLTGSGWLQTLYSPPPQGTLISFF